ncbi:unnamed protein product [Sphagnum balticum]
MMADTPMCIPQRLAQKFWLRILPYLTILQVLGALILLVVTAPVIAATATVSVGSPPTSATAEVPTLHQQVVGALRAAGRFGAVSGILDSLTNVDEIIKPDITLFAPDDTAFENVLMNSSSVLTTLLNYQTASRFYAFQDLMSLRAGDRIPTVTPGISILVVSVNGLNYRLDDAFVVAPDLYTNGTVVVAVHGVSAIFSTRQYNTATLGPVPAPAPIADAAAAAAAAPAPVSTSPTKVPDTAASSSSTPATGSNVDSYADTARTTRAHSLVTFILAMGVIAVITLL